MAEPSAQPTPLDNRIAGGLGQVGAMLQLAGQVARRSVRRPITYGGEFVDEMRFAVRIAWFPIILTSFALAFGPAGIQASNFFSLLGSLDRLGSAYELIVVREFAPLVTAIIIAGVVGTSMCADLGARQVREEIAALSVLGVDPIKSLVIPRVLTIVAASVLFDIFARFSGLAGAMLVVVQNGASLLKCAVYGAVIAIVCCYKGIRASGGSQGVGRAVNQAVVIAFLAIGAIDYVFTQLLLATHPILSETR
jgi:phospholipid/cholesterol/gamma-HCH transport system permease protein